MSKADNTEAQSHDEETPLKRIFCIHEADEQMIDEIKTQYGLNRSDIARRGIQMLYEYLVLDKLPTGHPASEVEAHLRGEADSDEG